MTAKELGEVLKDVADFEPGECPGCYLGDASPDAHTLDHGCEIVTGGEEF